MKSHWSPDFRRISGLIRADAGEASKALLAFLGNNPDPWEALNIADDFLYQHLDSFIDEIERVVETNKPLADVIVQMPIGQQGSDRSLRRLMALQSRLRRLHGFGDFY